MNQPKTTPPQEAVSILDSAAHKRTEKRMWDSNGSIREAFDGLELGWGFYDLIDYLAGSETFGALGAEARGRVAGMVAAFAIVVAEKERESRISIADLVDSYSDGTLCPAAADTIRALVREET